MGKQYHSHAIRGLRNRWWTHLTIRWVKRRMAKSDSGWDLVIRYRSPRRGCRYDRFGNLKRSEARRVSVYFQERSAVKAERQRAARRRQYQREEVAHLAARIVEENRYSLPELRGADLVARARKLAS